MEGREPRNHTRPKGYMPRRRASTDSTEPAPLKPCFGSRSASSRGTAISRTIEKRSSSDSSIRNALPVCSSIRPNPGIGHNRRSQDAFRPMIGQRPSIRPKSPKISTRMAMSGVKVSTSDRFGTTLRRGPKKYPSVTPRPAIRATIPTPYPPSLSGTANQVPSSYGSFLGFFNRRRGAASWRTAGLRRDDRSTSSIPFRASTASVPFFLPSLKVGTLLDDLERPLPDRILHGTLFELQRGQSQPDLHAIIHVLQIIGALSQNVSCRLLNRGSSVDCVLERQSDIH